MDQYVVALFQQRSEFSELEDECAGDRNCHQGKQANAELKLLLGHGFLAFCWRRAES